MPSAGEVEQFAYCAHNWWLARGGHDPGGPGADRGIAEHRILESSHRTAGSALREAAMAQRWMTLVLAMAAASAFLTVEVFELGDPRRRWILVALGLFLVGASASLLVLSLWAERRAAEALRAYGLAPATLRAAGGAGTGPTLEDPHWDLRGTPDYLIESRHGLVPVEVKTGRTPSSPHRSHVLQLACYMHLLEVVRGSPPPYGLLQYPKGVFRVEWTPALRQELEATLERMRRAHVDGGADRDHEHVARCRGCARRGGCSQSLA